LQDGAVDTSLNPGRKGVRPLCRGAQDDISLRIVDPRPELRKEPPHQRIGLEALKFQAHVPLEPSWLKPTLQGSMLPCIGCAGHRDIGAPFRKAQAPTDIGEPQSSSISVKERDRALFD
jgi:hypothetical protein